MKRRLTGAALFTGVMLLLTSLVLLGLDRVGVRNLWFFLPIEAAICFISWLRWSGPVPPADARPRLGYGFMALVAVALLGVLGIVAGYFLLLSNVP